jgi:hypothetical protein
MYANVRATLKLGNTAGGLPYLSETIVGILVEQGFGQCRGVFVGLTVKIVCLQYMVLGIEDVAAITDH